MAFLEQEQPEAVAADHVLRHCGNLAAGEQLVIVCDAGTREIADLFAVRARSLTPQVQLHEISAFEMHGQEPPAPVAEAMRTADLILGLTRMSMAHSRARVYAAAKGARYLSMPDYSWDLLHSPALSADYHAAAPLVKRFATALTAASSLRVTTPAGTDISLNVAGRCANFCPGYVDMPGALGSPPDIEANISPIEADSSGSVIVDGSIPCPDIGLLREPVSLTVREGAIVAIESRDYRVKDRLHRLFESVGSDKAYVLAECGIGLNPAADLSGNMLTDEGAFGCMHFGFGSNATVGGVNEVPFHLDFVFRQPSLLIDGATAIDGGTVLL